MELPPRCFPQRWHHDTSKLAESASSPWRLELKLHHPESLLQKSSFPRLAAANLFSPLCNPISLIWLVEMCLTWGVSGFAPLLSSLSNSAEITCLSRLNYRLSCSVMPCMCKEVNRVVTSYTALTYFKMVDGKDNPKRSSYLSYKTLISCLNVGFSWY